MSEQQTMSTKANKRINSHYLKLFSKDFKLPPIHLNTQTNISENIFYCLAFLIPVLMMLIYCIYRGVFPFGDSTLLNNDLRQQYIDFFAWAHRTLFQHFDQIFYSFSKSLGGDMVSVWAYYLLSPFNILLLLFSAKWLPVGIFVITLLKYGCISLAFYFLLNQLTNLSPFYKIAYSIAYTFCGWSLANQTNIIWTDVLIWLPLVVWGLHLLFYKDQSLPYILFLSITLFTNFYMGYMVCIFVVLLFISQIILSHYNITKLRKTIWNFIKSSLLAGGLCAVLLIPTFVSMLNSKGQYTAHFSFSTQYYNPFNYLFKLAIGAFDDGQYSNGLANIFIPSFFVLTFLLMFFSKHFSKREKLVAFLLPAFLYISFMSVTLILIWHAFQLPLWYNYRFSFLFSFILLLISAFYVDRLSEKPIPFRQFYFPLFYTTFFLCFLWLNKNYYSFITPVKIKWTIGFYVISLIGLFLYPRIAKRFYSKDLYGVLLVLLVIFESMTNIFYTFENSVYDTFSNYTSYLQSFEPYVHKIQQKEHTPFYRVEKNFARSKNDEMQFGYAGVSHFNSMFESEIPNFIGNIGNPRDSVNAYYTNPTYLSDSLLGIKYYLTTRTYHGQDFTNSPIAIKYPFVLRDDIKYYYHKTNMNVSQSPYINVYQNPMALSLGYAVSDPILKLTSKQKDKNNPILYQTQILEKMTNQNNSLGNPVSWSKIRCYNMQKRHFVFSKTHHHNNKNLFLYERLDNNNEAYVEYVFRPKNNNTYYIMLPGGINLISTLALNNQLLRQAGDYNNNVVAALGTHAKGKSLVFRTSLKDGQNRIAPIQLLQINDKQVQHGLKTLQKHQWHLSKVSATHLVGTINMPANKHLVFTSIPYSKGWQAYVDGRPAHTINIMKAFEGIYVPYGTHTLSLKYHVPCGFLGLIVSIVSLSFIVIDFYSLSNTKYHKKYK